MVHRWARPALGLIACLLLTSTASGQRASQRAAGPHSRGALGENDPNPFSRQTRIPFTVGDSSCPAGTQRHVVTLRIYNILSQVVAFGTLADSASSGETTAVATPRVISEIALPCGKHEAKWDGKHTPDGRDASPGVYMYQLLIDGHSAGTRKMLLTR